MFLFFSSRLGCLGSIAVSTIVTVVLLLSSITDDGKRR